MNIVIAAKRSGVLALCLACSVHAQAEPRTLHKTGWFAGLPVAMDVQLPKAHGGTAPDAPSAERPDVTVYITAPTLKDSEHQQAATVATPDGPRVVPPHNHVLARMVPARAPAESIGYFVVPGPNADDSKVRSQPDPENSWPGAPLVREIFVGTDWVKLNNHAIIEYGLAMGWLALRYFDYGGLVSTRYLDESVRLDVQIATTPAPSLPAGSR